MTRLTIIFLIGLLWSCTDHSTQERNQSNKTEATNEEALTETVDSLPAKELEKLLRIPIRQKFNEKYSGHYSYKMTSLGDKELHGPFLFTYSDSSALYNNATNEYENDMISVLKVRYSGQFENGKKQGEFIEQLLHNDGVDLYSKWTVTIDFKDNQCKSGTFKGIMGHIMPETTYHYDNLDTCIFDFVVNKASTAWGKEYTKLSEENNGEFYIIIKNDTIPGRINQSEIQKLNEPLKALTALYSALGGTYCDGEYCKLTTALGLGKQGSEKHKNLIVEYFPNDEKANTAIKQDCYLRPSGASSFTDYEYLTIKKEGLHVEVHYRLMYYNRGEVEWLESTDKFDFNGKEFYRYPD